MFKFEFIAEDKHVLELMRLLANKVGNLQVVPVLNAEKKANGQYVAKGADAVELFSQELHKRKIESITPSEMRKVIGELGLSPSSYSYYMTMAMRTGVLRRGKKMKNNTGYHYTVLPVKS